MNDSQESKWRQETSRQIQEYEKEALECLREALSLALEDLNDAPEPGVEVVDDAYDRNLATAISQYVCPIAQAASKIKGYARNVLSVPAEQVGRDFQGAQNAYREAKEALQNFKGRR